MELKQPEETQVKLFTELTTEQSNELLDPVDHFSEVI